jgi:hypothetical protein
MQLPKDGESCGIVYFYDTLRNGTAEVALNPYKLFYNMPNNYRYSRVNEVALCLIVGYKLNYILSGFFWNPPPKTQETKNGRKINLENVGGRPLADEHLCAHLPGN